MNYARVYLCSTCRHEKALPEHPETGPDRVRAGCPTCGTIRSFIASGTQGPPPRWR